MSEISAIVKKHFNKIELGIGEHFVKEGQYSKSMGFVASGLLHSYQTNSKGETITTNFFLPGTFCGAFYSFYRQQPSFENIKSITGSCLYVMGYDKLQNFLKTDLVFNQLGRMAIEEVCISKDLRISKMLQLQSKERYLWLLQAYPLIAEKAPLQHIASYLGMKPESLSRIRKELSS